MIKKTSIARPVSMIEPAVTGKGAKAIIQDGVPSATGLDNLPASAPTTEASAKPRSKRALVLDLLRRDDGATLPELMAVTGWQAHSVRAVLTGLRKSGLILEKSIRNSATCYQILEDADARG